VKKILILLVTVLILSLVACSAVDPYDSVISGDFVYTQWDMSEGEIAIIGLSDEGKEKDTLIFPSILDGFRVTQIGSKFGLKDTGVLEIEIATKIYFTNEIIHIATGVVYSKGMTENMIHIYVGSNFPLHELFTWKSQKENSKIFMCQEYYNHLVSLDLLQENYVPVNVEYYTDEDTLYFVDNAEDALVNVIPPVPYKEGYEFVGWFKDTDFNQPFVFDEDVIPTKQFDNENLLINITKIYAKWQ
jgi:hypothetical protein